MTKTKAERIAGIEEEIRQLENKRKQLVQEQMIGQDEVSKTYSFPKSYVSYRKPRAVSTEQRDAGKAMFHRFGR